MLYVHQCQVWYSLFAPPLGRVTAGGRHPVGQSLSGKVVIQCLLNDNDKIIDDGVQVLSTLDTGQAVLPGLYGGWHSLWLFSR